jgi:hypothetical protein
MALNRLRSGRNGPPGKNFCGRIGGTRRCGFLHGRSWTRAGLTRSRSSLSLNWPRGASILLASCPSLTALGSRGAVARSPIRSMAICAGSAFCWTIGTRSSVRRFVKHWPRPAWRLTSSWRTTITNAPGTRQPAFGLRRLGSATRRADRMSGTTRRSAEVLSPARRIGPGTRRDSVVLAHAAFVEVCHASGARGRSSGRWRHTWGRQRISMAGVGPSVECCEASIWLLDNTRVRMAVSSDHYAMENTVATAGP